MEDGFFKLHFLRSVKQDKARLEFRRPTRNESKKAEDGDVESKD